MLVDLGNTGQEFQGNTVVNRSVFINPVEIGYLADDENRCVVLTIRTLGFAPSHRRWRLYTGRSIKQFLAVQREALNPTSTLDVASTLNRIVSSTDKRVPPFVEPSIDGALDYISFVAHVFLHSEAFFVPSPREQSS